MHSETSEESFAAADEVLTIASFERLAVALRMTWPEWYRRYVYELLAPPLAGYQVHLPGGLTFALPQLIYRSTMAYREGRVTLHEWVGTEYQVAAWPHSYVIIGNCGEGDLAIDTATEDGKFLNIYKEDYAIRPLANISAMGSSPEQAARAAKAHQIQSDATERERHHKKLVNPFFDVPGAK